MFHPVLVLRKAGALLLSAVLQALAEVLGSKALGWLILELTRACIMQWPVPPPAPPGSVSNDMLTALTLGAECVPV